MLRSANEESWIRASRRTYRPCESTFKDCSLKSSWSLTRIRTLLLWLVPWEKNVSPFHCFSHSFSTSGVPYVSWRKHISAEDLSSQLKIDFLYQKREFGEKKSLLFYAFISRIVFLDKITFTVYIIITYFRSTWISRQVWNRTRGNRSLGECVRYIC